MARHTAARRFFEQAIGTTKMIPVEVLTDEALTYPMVLVWRSWLRRAQGRRTQRSQL
jgi:hypothetical protein